MSLPLASQLGKLSKEALWEILSNFLVPCQSEPAGQQNQRLLFHSAFELSSYSLAHHRKSTQCDDTGVHFVFLSLWFYNVLRYLYLKDVPRWISKKGYYSKIRLYKILKNIIHYSRNKRSNQFSKIGSNRSRYPQKNTKVDGTEPPHWSGH